MLDVVTRALLHPVDYFPVLFTREITFKEKRHEGENIYSFIFDMPKPFTWKAGQHAIFTMPGKKLDGKTWRPFSVASSPQEGVVQIGTTIPEPHSDFKDKLMHLKPGECLRIFGPFGEFHASGKPQQIVGIAGGIGITPFRSLAHEVAHQLTHETKLTLIYSARDFYTYKNELDSWQNKSDNLEIIYTHTSQEVSEALHGQYQQHGNSADYYISGSPGMISALRKTCKDIGIRRVVNDPFKGY